MMMEQELLKPFVASEFCDTDSMKPTYWRTDLLITRAVPVESEWYEYGRSYIIHAVQGVEICRYVGRLRPCDDGYQVTFDNKTFAPVHLTRAQVLSVCRVVGFLRMEE